jgi:thioredoxin reductase (NADPH)
VKYKAAVIGAGPIGIEVAALFKRNGISYIQFDKGPVGATLTKWPRNTRFFSSTEWIAIAGMPIHNNEQAGITAELYLAYLRQLIEILDLEIHSWEEVCSISGSKGNFEFITKHNGRECSYRAENIILATGDMSFPKMLDIPGEDLPHVTHYWQDPHLYFQKDLLIVGGRNSAVEAAIRCWRAGVNVSLSYRGKELESSRLISRLHLEIDLLIKRKQIVFLPETTLSEIQPGSVELKKYNGKIISHNADFVYLASGFRMDFTLFRMLDVKLEGEDEIPCYDADTMETNTAGVYIAGTASAGNQYKGFKIFIATCHDHGIKILSSIAPEKYGPDLYRQVGNIPGRDYPLSSDDIE